MYNLDEQLAGKAEKQIVKMLSVRRQKEIASMGILDKYDHYPYNDIPKYQTMVRDAERAIQDVSNWMYSAYCSFVPEMWDRMIVDAGFCLEGNCFEDLSEGGLTWDCSDQL